MYYFPGTLGLVVLPSRLALVPPIEFLLCIPDKYAMERGGWSTPSVLKSVCQHTFSDERKLVDKRIDDYFNSLIVITHPKGQPFYD